MGLKNLEISTISENFLQKVPEENKSVSSSKKSPSFKQNLWYYFGEYCGNTSIHGLKFLGERNRSFVEKLWWFLLLSTSLYLCTRQIIKTYQKWERSPVIVTFATTEMPISEIPFPAVTICPLAKASKKRFNFTEAMLTKHHLEMMDKELDEDLKKKLAYMWLVCYQESIYFYDEYDIGSTYDETLEFLLSVQDLFDNSVERIVWSGKYFSTGQGFFSPIITHEGVCFSFNSVDRDELFTKDMSREYFEKRFSNHHQPPSKWSLEEGFIENSTFTDIPRRTAVFGSSGGLYMALKIDPRELDHVCGDATQGFKVILHHPSQVPDTDGGGHFRIGLNQDVSVAVKATMMTTSNELREYSPEYRKCYFAAEKTLKFYGTYDQHNCLLECFANFTLRHCGCVAFFMPRNSSTPICGLGKMPCIYEANGLFSTNEETREKDAHLQKDSCACLPSCTSLEYEIEVSQTEWNWRKARETAVLFDYPEPEEGHKSRLQIFFKQMQFLTMERNELYGATDFLANCGGLLGLFTGFSFISLVEILYYATLRLVCNVCKFGKRYWSGAEELLQK